MIFGDGLDTATVVAIAADSSSIDFLANPGTTGIPTISGAALSILPTVPLTLPATTVTVGQVSAIAGYWYPRDRADLSPSPRQDSNFISTLRTFTGADLRRWRRRHPFYKLVPTDGDYTITIDWTAGSDLDGAVCDATASTGGISGATAAQPETATSP